MKGAVCKNRGMKGAVCRMKGTLCSVGIGE